MAVDVKQASFKASSTPEAEASSGSSRTVFIGAEEKRPKSGSPKAKLKQYSELRSLGFNYFYQAKNLQFDTYALHITAYMPSDICGAQHMA